ncbi:PIG-L family deacetylase [Krasilnikovia sp. M28-CT-15]|uniref:PIG-L family deacetylase n=1 Tax=Krasilnikovia sp. M28-CT-15 TaxID=3373540 RepID=UPI003876D426
MADPVLTLMAVHAHPDDESTSTGGVLAHYALAGVRTIVVTCTNGELGDAPGGAKPGDAGHHPGAVAAVRRGELRDACEILGVSAVEMLGYHDSGMPDWPYRDRPDVFCNVPVEQAALRVGAHFDTYRPDVVVTYDPHTSYQHPDHIHTARVTARAAEITGIPRKLYFKAHGSSYWADLRAALNRIGIARPAPDATRRAEMDAVQQRISTTIDARAVADRKRRALLAHRSQLGSSLAAKLPPELFAEVLGVETYIRATDSTGSPTPEQDLFSGLRQH